MERLVIIGSGNVATHLAMALKRSCQIVQIYSRNAVNAQKLAAGISSTCHYTDNPKALMDADTYILSIKDDGIKSFLMEVPDELKTKLWVHTSGSVPRSVFERFSDNNGVMYPLQTFSKNVELDMGEVPFFIESSNAETDSRLVALAKSMSEHVYHADSRLREQLHIAAVFACNFTNFMYCIADDLLSSNHLPFSVLQPLIKETTRKITTVSPEQAQTGPASRGDVEIIDKHLNRLTDKSYQEIYSLVSNNILMKFNQHKS